MEPPPPPTAPSSLIDQYKAYMDDVGKIGDRHQTARGFYLSVVSALFVFLSMAGDKGPFIETKPAVQLVVGFAGIAICFLWFCHMQAFGALFKAKFDVLRKMEINLPHQIFAEEWEHLKCNRKYAMLTFMDSLMPVVFGVLCVAIAILKDGPALRAMMGAP